MSRQPSVDARLISPKPTATPEAKPTARPTTMPETKFTFDPTNPAHLRAKATLEWAAKRGKPEPEKISQGEHMYRLITRGPRWIDIEEAARQEAERRKTPPGWMGTCGDEFSC